MRPLFFSTLRNQEEIRLLTSFLKYLLAINEVDQVLPSIILTIQGAIVVGEQFLYEFLIAATNAIENYRVCN